MRNKLFLNRLIIYTLEGKTAYDETFRKGINIIRGDNSSGKSTLTHFIFFVLGGAFNEWVKEAKKCSEVYAEVELNGARVTLKRAININEQGIANSKEAIQFYWGSIEDALDNSEGWQRFSFNTTENRKSFSNVLFENLELPIVKGENNITFHQILRLLYVDQDSPTSSLFYYEQFDSSLTRETVSDLLLGVYNQDLYDFQQRLIEVDRELSEINKELKVIKRFISDPFDLSPSNILVKIEKKEAEIVELEEQIGELREGTKALRYTKSTKLEFEKLNSDAIQQRELISTLDKSIRSLKFEIEDTKFFIEALLNKVSSVKKSVLTRELLGEFPLESCPECLSDLEITDDKVCKLCKKEIDETFGVTQARKIEQELSFQIKESKALVLIKERELLNIVSEYDSEQIKLHQIQQKVNSSISDVKSLREERLDNIYVEKGFAEGEILQLRTLLENAEIYQGLVARQSKLKEEFNYLNSTIFSLKANQEKLKTDVNREIENKGVFLLNNDLKRQSEFYEAKEFHIDYSNNLAFISDKDAKYSASSSFYLKTSARFSIFLASLEIEKMRFPRFIFCDNMEDKGIEPERARNFQRILVDECENHDNDAYQMIYTTSYIPPELDNSEYCIGDYYTEANPSLKNV